MPTAHAAVILYLAACAAAGHGVHVFMLSSPCLLIPAIPCHTTPYPRTPPQAARALAEESQEKARAAAESAEVLRQESERRARAFKEALRTAAAKARLDLEGEMRGLEKQGADIRQALAAAQAELAAAQDRAEAGEEAAGQLRGELAQAQAAEEAASAAAAAARAEAAGFAEQLAQVVEGLGLAQGEAAALRQQQGQLEARVAEAEARMAAAHEEMVALRQQAKVGCWGGSWAVLVWQTAARMLHCPPDRSCDY